MKVNGVEIDACKGGCGGIWFDAYEFQRFDEPHEHSDELLRLGDKRLSFNESQKRSCPKCENVVMKKHFFSVKRNVEIDECGVCGGIWLDPGELAQIWRSFGSEEERSQQAEKVFEDMFGAGLDKLKEKSKKENHTATRFANLLRFICPSYYMKGDQNWGAF
jgi:hypothetical protein